jgi:hypothetical protein
MRRGKEANVAPEKKRGFDGPEKRACTSVPRRTGFFYFIPSFSSSIFSAPFSFSGRALLLVAVAAAPVTSLSRVSIPVVATPRL